MAYSDSAREDGAGQTRGGAPRRGLPRRRVVHDIVPPAGLEPLPPLAPKPVSGEPETRLSTSGARSASDALAALFRRRTRPQGYADIPVRTWEPEAMRRSRLRFRAVAGAATVVAGLGFLLPTFAFPRLTITVVPELETVPVRRLELIADTAATAIDASGRRIPGLLIEIDRKATGEYDATGTKFFQERAQGEVRLYNAFSSAPQSLIAQTRLQDQNGKVFRLRQGVTVPGAEVREGQIVPTSVAAEVVADASGAAYNIGPTEFRIPGFRGTPKYQAFYARSEREFAGGFVGEARIVTSADLSRASEDITRRLVEGLKGELAGKVPPGEDFLAPDDGREIIVTAVEQPKPGDRFSRFPVTASARGRLVVFSRAHLFDVLAALVVPPGALPARVAPQASRVETSSLRSGQGRGELRLSASGELAYWREPDIAELTDTLRSSTPRKAEAYLRGREEIGAFRVNRFPMWLWFIPSRTGGLIIRSEPPA